VFSLLAGVIVILLVALRLFLLFEPMSWKLGM